MSALDRLRDLAAADPEAFGVYWHDGKLWLCSRGTTNCGSVRYLTRWLLERAAQREAGAP